MNIQINAWTALERRWRVCRYSCPPPMSAISLLWLCWLLDAAPSPIQLQAGSSHLLPLWEWEDLTLKPTLQPLLVTNVTVTVMANFPWSYFLGCPAIFLVSVINLGFSCCSSNSNRPLQDYTEKLFNTVLHWAKGDTKYRQVCKHFSKQVITVARRVYLLEVLQIFSI